MCVAERGATPRVSGLPAVGLLPRMDFDHSPVDDLSSPRAPVGGLEPLWASRSFRRDRVLVCMGEPLGSPLLTPQEECSSKTKARGCKLASSGRDPVHKWLRIGPCNGVFFWFVLSQRLKIGKFFWLFLDIEIASNLGLEFPQSSNQ